VAEGFLPFGVAWAPLPQAAKTGVRWTSTRDPRVLRWKDRGPYESRRPADPSSVAPVARSREARMEKRGFGRTGLQVTVLGHGAMEIRGPRVWAEDP